MMNLMNLSSKNALRERERAYVKAPRLPMQMHKGKLWERKAAAP